jgi:hypothetical protein
MLMYREYWYGSLFYIKEHESFFQMSYAFLILCETLNVYLIVTRLLDISTILISSTRSSLDIVW